MRSCLFLTVLFLLAATPVQGASLKGLILANEQDGPPVPNVEVAAVAGASPTATDTLGKFTLSFPTKGPGEMVQVIVNKPGHVVVNDIQLRLQLPKDPDAVPLILLLCKVDDREEMARRFFRLTSIKAIDARYQDFLKELEAKHRSTAAALEELGRERDQAKALAERAAEELARLKPEQTSELFQQAMSLFVTGKIEEALQILDEAKLRRSVKATRQRKADAERNLTEAIQGYLLRAKLLTTQLRFTEAERAYQAAIDAMPDSFDAHFGLAYFTQGLNRHYQALTAYQRALDLARRSRSIEDVSMTLHNLGVLLADLNQPVEARQAYEEALKLERELAARTPERYLPGVAMTLNNLGNLLFGLNQPVEARQAYEEALKIRRELAARAPESYLPDLATTLNSLGNLLGFLDQPAEARQAYEEALKLERELAARIPESYLPALATILNNLGNLLVHLNQPVEARQAYEEALKLERELAARTPERYLPDVAMTLSNLGNLLGDLNQPAEARQAYEEALDIYEKFSKKSDERYEPAITMVRQMIKVLDEKASVAK